MSAPSPRAALLAVTLLAPAPALACGGFFCNAAQLLPVEQNAERILFEVHGDGTISTTVEIAYSGAPEDFSWILPVPATPTVDVVSPQLLQILDASTGPSLQGQRTFCSNRRGGCSVASAELGGAPSTAETLTAVAAAPLALYGCADNALLSAGRYDEVGSDPVQVEQLPQVGPYLIDVVSSDDPGALVDWLDSEGYLLTKAMEPFIQGYVAQGMKFLAMKLAADASISDVAPVRMTYPADDPMIPLVLTSVSAEPEMGVKVFVAAAERYQAANWSNLLMDPSDLIIDTGLGRSNYFPLVSWQVDMAGGRAFVTEFAGPATGVAQTARTTADFPPWPLSEDAEAVLELEAAATQLEDIAVAKPWLTRLYTRISAWEMTEDPTFEASPGGAISNTHDLSPNPPVDSCSPLADRTCGATYCGFGAECATTETGDPGCVCPAGSVAKLVQTPTTAGQAAVMSVVCQDATFDLMVDVDGFQPGSPQDPCLDVDCGAGQCAALGGFPTCECDAGTAAIASVGETGSDLRCVSADQTFGPEAMTRRTDAEFALMTPAPTSSRGLAVVLLAGLLPLVMLRKR